MPPSSDVFRPRLPIDPFSTIDQHQPWRVPAQFPASVPQVVLILGEPSYQDLSPLLTSPHLATSLLLIASHVPPPIPPLPPSLPGPAIRILRLASPLNAHDSGALRLLWRMSSRASGDSPLHVRIIQLAEEGVGGEFSVVEEFVFADADAKRRQEGVTPPPLSSPERGSQSYPSPAPSIASSASTRHSSYNLSLRFPFFSSPATSRTPSPSTSTSSLRLSSALSSSTSLTSTGYGNPKLKRTQSALRVLMKQQQHEQERALYGGASHGAMNGVRNGNGGGMNGFRGFDALVNFLPGGGVPDKALLKHAILVTTLSAQYLAPPNLSLEMEEEENQDREEEREEGVQRAKSKRFSLFSGSHEAHQSTTSLSPSTKSKKKRFSILGSSSSQPPLPSSSAHLSQTYADSQPPSSFPSYTSTSTTSLGPIVSSQYRSDVSPRAKGAKTAQKMRTQRAKRPRNAHIVHVLPRDWRDVMDDVGYGSSGGGLSEGGLHPDSASRRGSRVYDKRSSVYAPKKQQIQKPKLVQSVEQFLLSFAYPLMGGAGSTGSLGVVSGVSGNVNSNGVGMRRAGMVGSSSCPATMSSNANANGNRRPALLSLNDPSSPTSSSPSPSSASPSSSRPTSSASSSSTSPGMQSRPTSMLSTLSQSYQGEMSMIERARMMALSKPVPFVVKGGVWGEGVWGSRRVVSGGSSSLGSVMSCGGVSEEGDEDMEGVDKGKEKEEEEMTVGEIIVLGGLDSDLDSPDNANMWMTGGGGLGRAWVGSVDDVVVIGSEGRSVGLRAQVERGSLRGCAKGIDSRSNSKGQLGHSSSRGQIARSNSKGQLTRSTSKGQLAHSTSKGQLSHSNSKGQLTRSTSKTHLERPTRPALPTPETSATSSSSDSSEGSVEDEEEPATRDTQVESEERGRGRRPVSPPPSSYRNVAQQVQRPAPQAQPQRPLTQPQVQVGGRPPQQAQAQPQVRPPPQAQTSPGRERTRERRVSAGAGAMASSAMGHRSRGSVSESGHGSMTTTTLPPPPPLPGVGATLMVPEGVPISKRMREVSVERSLPPISPPATSSSSSTSKLSIFGLGKKKEKEREMYVPTRLRAEMRQGEVERGRTTEREAGGMGELVGTGGGIVGRGDVRAREEGWGVLHFVVDVTLTPSLAEAFEVSALIVDCFHL
ncbi:hypothetical protein BJ165DRAFT_1400864 [Panaeolus papilionaceus]|nr:hypothetical protein BJ165DRAFT_1400864 [Panaeolus papilionaceus]